MANCFRVISSLLQLEERASTLVLQIGIGEQSAELESPRASCVV